MSPGAYPRLGRRAPDSRADLQAGDLHEFCPQSANGRWAGLLTIQDSGHTLVLHSNPLGDLPALPGRQQEFDIFGSELHSFAVFEKTSTCTSTSTSTSSKSVIIDVHVVVDVAVDGF